MLSLGDKVCCPGLHDRHVVLLQGVVTNVEQTLLQAFRVNVSRLLLLASLLLGLLLVAGLAVRLGRRRPRHRRPDPVMRVSNVTPSKRQGKKY